ncbi:MAG TPA: 50S ribosomal protein L3 [Gammaproteobacteria bacterium]|nr:50S ribosomal protein L3 [Gammaproteobacteria bacterium]
MSIGVVGRKLGMSRVFTEDGASVPVSVIEVLANRVCQVKNEETDGYTAIQVTSGARKASRVNKPMAGHFKKAGVEPGRGLWEFRVDGDHGYEVGAEIGCDIFEPGQVVDVSGVTIGKGFAGTIKRHNFAGKDATHGNSINHRTPGSIGQCQTPGRVFKGKKMSGHMGNVKRTQQNLEVVKVDAERNLVLIKGSVPGSKGGDVIIAPAVKKKG